ncbi:class I SAM-dependent methyltransferase [Bacillus shivajii]|uniref:class I SAM-dependent methyltransferase n=1 Tax=Bacillus shivajii TaxID=1983719 RepID=UPI001CFB2954|nr:class I SAM-dependent methyltransferase [Bacillus shivajii]UCZ53623.1 class I SAM-dependent methyltransferase [Bacillus shivajii]
MFGMNFHDPINKKSYTERQVSDCWKQTIANLLKERSTKKGVDIGCGGGIYSRGLKDLGIDEVIGVDFSKTMLNTAKFDSKNYDNLHYSVGSAYNTGLPSNTFNLTLSRAVIHHLGDLERAVLEMYRILQRNGQVIVQDRTLDDCMLPGSHTHIRGYFFSTFPQLKEIETERRYEGKTVISVLKKAGFKNIQELKLWETRKIYDSKTSLFNEIITRKGRSILHELTEKELQILIKELDTILPNETIVEKDRWTIWTAEK